MSRAAAGEERRKDPGGDPRARTEGGVTRAEKILARPDPRRRNPFKKPTKVLDVRHGFALENFEKS